MTKIKNCRFCNERLNQFMTFGDMPIANAFLTKEEIEGEYYFELTPSYCPNCALFQLIEQPDPKMLFHENYAFFAGTSVLMQKHFKALADKIILDYNLKPNDLTVEIGNNDGGIVEYLKNKGFSHLGVDPSKNVADEASSKGVRMLNKFFNKETASIIKKEYGSAKIFLAANTLAHIPNINSVFEGVDELLTDDGVFITEDPYLLNLLEKTSYDQIYDEHVFIFNLTAMSNICKRYDLEVFDIEYLNTAGGSLRYYICRNGKYPRTERLSDCKVKENAMNLYSDQTYLLFKENCEKSKDNLLSLLTKIKNENAIVAGYGATSKSTTIFNYCGIGPDLIDYITDTTITKINKLSPGKHIPIYDYNYFLSNMPEYCYLLAWNHKIEIMEKEKNNFSGDWITHIPEVKVFK